jgi:hypothetical protein
MTTIDSLVSVSDRPATAAEVRARVNLIQEVMRAVMKDGMHYGTIPGTPKPTLYKAGSEVILSTFRIGVDPEVEDLSIPGEEARFRVRARGVSQGNGVFLGAGVGECSSSEEKYRWRGIVHQKEWDATPEDRRRVKFTREGEEIQQVRTNPSDVANTILKMAKKRAQIDMTLTVTAASDVFAQDIEDLPEELRGAADVDGHGHKAAPASVRRSQAGTETGPLPDGVVRIVKIDEKSGTSKGGKPYVKRTITDSAGKKYGTFNDALGKLAVKCRDARTPVQIAYESGQYGNDITEITVWEPPAKAEPAAGETAPSDAATEPAATETAASREPGEEG